MATKVNCLRIASSYPQPVASDWNSRLAPEDLTCYLYKTLRRGSPGLMSCCLAPRSFPQTWTLKNPEIRNMQLRTLVVQPVIAGKAGVPWDQELCEIESTWPFTQPTPWIWCSLSLTLNCPQTWLTWHCSVWKICIPNISQNLQTSPNSKHYLLSWNLSQSSSQLWAPKNTCCWGSDRNFHCLLRM